MSLNPLFAESHKRQKKVTLTPPKLEPPSIPIPKGLLPQEASALRSLVSVFDSSVSGKAPTEEKQKAIMEYLSAYITKYNTPELRNLIPEQAELFSDEEEETLEEEALRTGENLYETDDESDEEPEEYTAEDLAFIASDNEIEYEDGYDPEEDAKKQKKIEQKCKRKRQIEVEEEDE
jgi:hypothetical protein